MFNEIPVIDLDQDKPAVLKQLRHALLNVGFCYIRNYGVDPQLISKVVALGKQLFELPVDEKRRIDMANSPHFLGYSRLGDEITKNKTDWREQMDLATELEAPDDHEPLYRRLRGPNQWPDERLIPGFRATYEAYIEQMGPVSIRFVSLIAEALGLQADAFAHLFDANQQHKLKVVRYPDVAEVEGIVGEKDVKKVKKEDIQVKKEDLDEDIVIKKESGSTTVKQEPGDIKQESDSEPVLAKQESDPEPALVKQESGEPTSKAKKTSSEYSQGVGPHKDSELTSYLLQCTDHRGLQVLNSNNQWIDVPPIEGTLVVAMGQAMEALTRGYCVSTTHRVLAPEAGSGSRFSVPFFQGISYDANFRDFQLPREVEEKLKKQQVGSEEGDADRAGQYNHAMFQNIGEATFMNRIKSHPSVAQRWYRDIIDVSKLDKLPELLQRLVVVFAGCERAMMFHDSPSPLTFDVFAKQVLEHSGEKMTTTDLQQLFVLWPGLYRTETRRDGVLLLSLEGVSTAYITQYKNERVASFETKCWSWLKRHPVTWRDGPVPDSGTGAEIRTSGARKRGVSETAASLRKEPVTKQKIYKTAKPDTKLGGSVLERIKARQAAAALLKPKSDHEIRSETQLRFIDSNIPQVVDVLVSAGNASSSGTTMSLPMTRAAQLVRDSLRKTSLSDREARAILVRVSHAVPSFCKLVEVGAQSVLRLTKKTRGQVQDELRDFLAKEEAKEE